MPDNSWVNIAYAGKTEKRERAAPPPLVIQILQHEFLGPVLLSEWGPPMTELVYLVMSRNDDRFAMLYAGSCDSTDDVAFFVRHPEFKCWVKHSGSEASLHVAVLPMSGSRQRTRAVDGIISRYRPPCNPTPAEKRPYRVRRG